jgi:aminoglycoside phosphotransferase (APT) family kinase protein
VACVTAEEVLHGGAVNPSVVRVGDTVRRTPSAATPAVHDLLRHLETKGFDGSPRALGFDDQGREMLSFIEGHVSLDGEWPDVLHRDEGLIAVVELVARFHDAVADYAPEPPLAPGEIVCHGDPGPWNIVWHHDEPIALIDWDFATRAAPMYDVSYIAFEMVPLRNDERCRALGFEEIPDRVRRLRLVCDTYGRGATPQMLIDLAERHQLADIDEIEEHAPADEARQMLEWLRLHREMLLG